MNSTNFESSLSQLKQWKAMAREGWNWKNQYISLQKPTAESKMTLPYLYISTVQGDLVPYLVSQTDLLAEDWIEIEI